MKTTLDIQRRLAELGYSPGPIDGIRGRKTIAAVERYQRAMGLEVDGVVGPQTLRALFGGASVETKDSPDATPWMDEARRYLGLHEVRDAKVLDKALDLDASEIPWCGAFCGLIIGSSLPSEPLPVNPLGARNWLKFGRSLDGPQVGAIAVFWRGSKDGWSGHVGVVAGHDKNHLHILGGNQSNSVTVSRIGKDRLLGYRWPETALPPPSTPLLMTTLHASITTNEA